MWALGNEGPGGLIAPGNQYILSCQGRGGWGRPYPVRGWKAGGGGTAGQKAAQGNLPVAGGPGGR
jgi:hypothetical protein